MPSTRHRSLDPKIIDENTHQHRRPWDSRSPFDCRAVPRHALPPPKGEQNVSWRECGAERGPGQQ
eukprot:607003-Pyramimonas_sp.AAC.1